MTAAGTEEAEARYRAVKSRDRRFDGVFYACVRTTGIYCRPSCPATTPLRRNVTFSRTAAEAQAAGFRACRRCLPDATPGSPAWDVTADVAGRAMRLIGDGVVEREGVSGLARRLGYSNRQLQRVLDAELGAGPLALARARRAQTARVLVETTTMPMSDIAFAAGFASIRQFNETVRAVYARSPTQLRRARSARRLTPSESGAVPRAGGEAHAAGSVDLRLAVRSPYAAPELLRFLALHAVPGLEESGPGWYARLLRLPNGPARVCLELDGDVGTRGHVRCRLEVADLRDLGTAVERCRRLLDADCDPVAVGGELVGDPLLAPLVRRRPGLRVPGQVDGEETALRIVVGQQVSLAAAVTVTRRLLETHGEQAVLGGRTVRLFPSAGRVAALDPSTLPMPRPRGRALVGLAAALAAGEIVLDRGADREEVRRRLLALPGIGPWTADAVALRALGHPDVFLATDLGVRNALRGLGEGTDGLTERSSRWRPWRSYALIHLWSSLDLLQPPRPDRSGPTPQPERTS